VATQTVAEQGGTTLSAATRNISGINAGGPSSFGFFDRFLVRGFDARIYSDGFPDGDQFNGFPHSLNGVDHVEVMKGPGSSLFGSGPPGGTINIVHAAPSAVTMEGGGIQVGSFGAVSSNVFATGATSVPGLNYRVDAMFQHADGFRDLESADYEFRPVINWIDGDHNYTLAFDARHIERTPDVYGIIYINGKPANVPSDTKYSTPFAHGNQDIQRITATDVWSVANDLTINSRLSVMNRDVDILRNAGGTISTAAVTGNQLSGRQLRRQSDENQDVTYQLEPVWKFGTGPIQHTLLTGLQVDYQHISDNRATADLPNITNVSAPVIPETSVNSLTFLRDATHSGMVDELNGTFVSTYATDQIDVNDRLKVRVGVRQEWWHEDLTPQVFVPGRIDGATGQLLEPGMTQSRDDTPVSWNVGALYKLTPDVAVFAGVARSYLTNFNSEVTSTGLAAPETGLEYEAGLRFTPWGGKLTVTTAFFDTLRGNVFNEDAVTSTEFFTDQQNVGFEADAQLQLTDKWKVLSNYIVQQARLTANPDQPSTVGNVPIGVPAEIFNVWSSYDFAIGRLDGFRFGVGVSYNAKSYADAPNTNSIPASTVVDLTLSYIQPKWDAEFGIKNVADVTYFTSAYSAGGFVGEPRTFFLKADWHT
jgi:iron complex outermembrane recepter protein